MCQKVSLQQTVDQVEDVLILLPSSALSTRETTLMLNVSGILLHVWQHQKTCQAGWSLAGVWLHIWTLQKSG